MSEQRADIKKTVAKLALLAVLMAAFVPLVMIPLYDVLCEQLGINGKTSGRYEVVDIKVDNGREITIQFVASNNEGMPWQFKPTVNSMKVNPGAVNNTAFYAKNPLSRAMVAQAVPSISPSRAAAYFHKTECFCFNQQPLNAGEDTDMPLQYIVDQALPKDIKTITLSYTLFDVTDRHNKEAAVATR